MLRYVPQAGGHVWKVRFTTETQRSQRNVSVPSVSPWFDVFMPIRRQARRSFTTAHFAQELFRGNRLASLSLRNGFEKHSFELGADLKFFFAVERQERDV